MRLNRIQIASTAALLAFAGAWLFAPAAAQIHTAPQPQTMGIPCRISWEETTHGGDWFTTQGEAELTRIIPQGDGKFVAFGTGHATVTYHSANHCRIATGNPFTASYDVTIASQDGSTAQIDIGSDDDSSTIETYCPGAPGTGEFDVNADPPGLPRVTAELHEGVTPFGEDHAAATIAGVQHAGNQGTVTLHYCTPENPNGH